MTTNRSILVTGATSGLGREMAIRLAARGQSVIASGRRQTRLNKLDAQENICGLQLDLTSPADIASACAELPSLSGVILNAGITFSDPFLSGNFETDTALIQTNVLANLQLIRALLPELKKQQGRILIIASLGGLTPLPYQSVYAGTKAFMINFGLSLREELKHENVKVGIFAPGGIKTEMTDVPSMKALEKNLAPVEAVADAALKAYERMPALNVPGAQNRLISAFSKLAPRSFIAGKAEKIYREARSGIKDD